MRRGFTLVETMAVLAIGGVLTSLAVVSLRDTTAAGSETRTARSLALVLRRARTTALTQHARVGVVVDLERQVLAMASCPQRWGTAHCADDAAVDVTPVLSWRSGDGVGVALAMSDADEDGHVVVFGADGVPGGEARFVVDHPLTPGAVEVLVSVAGDVRLQGVGARDVDDAR